MADISVTVNGMKFPNPFVLGSGPPGTNAKVINRSFDLGWGALSVRRSAQRMTKFITLFPVMPDSRIERTKR